jgi:hypothetical protein
VSALREQLGNDDPRGGLHEREVGERLREVAEVPARLGVELLGVLGRKSKIAARSTDASSASVS